MIETIYWAGREAVQAITSLICIAEGDELMDTVKVVQDDTAINAVGDEFNTDTLSFRVLNHVAFRGMKSVTLRQFDHGTHSANEIVLHHSHGEVTVYVLFTGN